MTRFIQICASQNDLFALDEEGDIYQYHFNVKTWVKLIANRESDSGAREAGHGGRDLERRVERRDGEGTGQGGLGGAPGSLRESITGLADATWFTMAEGIGRGTHGGGDQWNRTSGR